MNEGRVARGESRDAAHTVLELVTLTAGYLAKKGVSNARREAEDLLGHVLELDRLRLYLAFEQRPSPAELKAFRELVRRRGEREPLQHLLGWVPFAGLKLRCDARALVPRPETEALALLCRELLPGRGEPARCADLGTGSGCLALSLAAAGAGWVLATDASETALALARENAGALGLEGKLAFALGGLFGPFEAAGARGLDLLVSNPPYVAEGERGRLEKELAFEPEAALFAGADGLDVLRPLLAGAPEWLKPGGWLALECGLGQAAALAEGERARGCWAGAGVKKDPFGVERYLLCRMPG